MGLIALVVVFLPVRKGYAAHQPKLPMRSRARRGPWYGQDRALLARMTLSMLSVAVVDAAVLIGLALLGIGSLPIVAAAAAVVTGQLLLGPRCALAALRARRTSPQQEPALHAALER